MPDSSSLQPGYPKHAGRRHYACRYSLSTIEDYRALTLENELIRVTVLLDKGTDIIEFLYKPRDMDYLWRNRNGLRSPRAYQSMNPDPAATFLDWYEGGWQELFPFGGHTSAHRGLNTGMHGEVAYAPWQHEIVTDTEDEVSVRCFIRTRRYPCTLEKTFTIRKGEPALHIAEAASNESDAPIEVVWGHHPAFGWPFLHESCVVDFPEAVVCVENSLDQTGRLALNPRSRWPLVAGRDGKEVDISHVPPPSAQCHDLAVMQEFREGWYAIRNQDAGVGICHELGCQGISLRVVLAKSTRLSRLSLVGRRVCHGPRTRHFSRAQLRRRGKKWDRSYHGRRQRHRDRTHRLGLRRKDARARGDLVGSAVLGGRVARAPSPAGRGL